MRRLQGQGHYGGNEMQVSLVEVGLVEMNVCLPLSCVAALGRLGLDAECLRFILLV